MWKEAVVAYLEALLDTCLEELRKTTQKPQVSCLLAKI
jgi:hypothetical protein